MKVNLEIIVASLNGHASLRYLVSRHDISGNLIDPDHLIKDIISNEEHNHPTIPWDQCIIHSTSWRYEEDQSLVLTYIVYSDYAVFRQDSGKILSLYGVHTPKNGSLTRPRPAHIVESHVVAHGIRHLSHLVKRNSAMHKVLSSTSLEAFQALEGTLAGRIH